MKVWPYCIILPSSWCTCHDKSRGEVIIQVAQITCLIQENICHYTWPINRGVGYVWIFIYNSWTWSTATTLKFISNSFTHPPTPNRSHISLTPSTNRCHQIMNKRFQTLCPSHIIHYLVLFTHHTNPNSTTVNAATTSIHYINFNSDSDWHRRQCKYWKWEEQIVK